MSFYVLRFFPHWFNTREQLQLCLQLYCRAHEHFYHIKRQQLIFPNYRKFAFKCAGVMHFIISLIGFKFLVLPWNMKSSQITQHSSKISLDTSTLSIKFINVNSASEVNLTFPTFVLKASRQ